MGLDKAVNVALQVVIHYAHNPLSNIFYGLAAEEIVWRYHDSGRETPQPNSQISRPSRFTLAEESNRIEERRAHDTTVIQLQHILEPTER
jgi:hypothetical protein